MQPIVLFGIQFSVSLVAYALFAGWYVAPRLSRLPREVALVPLLWVHVFRIAAGRSWLRVRWTRACRIPSERSWGMEIWPRRSWRWRR
jgi:hypothetical protein